MKALSRFAQSLGKQEWFAKVGMKLAPVDLAVQERTGGRVSLLRMAGLPYLVLTTTGRRSGRPRSVPLLYVPHGADYLVVGSNWGQQHHPSWSANLLAHPDASVREREREVAVRGRLVTGEERERLWRDVITKTWPAYDNYAERAGDRELRVFALRPSE
ncbi:nitroreductase family deazaflavin-dependent oxidoreductase [Parasphingorhabdus pacifica]